MKLPTLIMTALACGTALAAAAAEQPAFADLVEPKRERPWLGQRLDFAVEVAVEGRFAGSTVFDLPELPGVILFRPEARPVLSSKQVEGNEFSVQRHEFSLFCQRPGPRKVEGITVRCGSVKEFGAEPVTHTLEVPTFTVNPRAQTDLLDGQLVVTSRQFEVTERWDPPPGEAMPGDAFRRSVSITASDVPGMLLPKLPHPQPDGLAVYPEAASIDDRTERGEFTGKRTEAVTYLCEAGGVHELPAVRFRCWNPDDEQWIERELPAVTITVSGPARSTEETPAARTKSRWPWLVAVLGMLGAGIAAAMLLRRRHDTPEAVALADLQTACERNHPASAVHEFHRWTSFHPGCTGSPGLSAALREAEEAIVSRSSWSGEALWQAVRDARKSSGRRPLSSQPPSLARLNP